MEQIKVFSVPVGANSTELEEQVNKWLGENSGIGIISRHVKTDMGTDRYCTIVIFYREKP